MGNCFIHNTNSMQRSIIVDESDLDLVTVPGCLVDATLIQKKFNELKYRKNSLLELASGMGCYGSVFESNSTTVHISAVIGSSTAAVIASSSSGVILGTIVAEARPKEIIHVPAVVMTTSGASQVVGYVEIYTSGVVRCYQTSGTAKNYCAFDVIFSIV